MTRTAQTRSEILGASWEGDRVKAEILLSKRLSDRVRARQSDNVDLRALVRSAIFQKPKAGSRRVTVVVPAQLLKDFARMCERENVTLSRRLGGRVRRHVDEDGEITRSYKRWKVPKDLAEKYALKKREEEKQVQGTLSDVEAQGSDKLFVGEKQVQVTLSDAEARGFDRFCRKSGVNKDGFLIAEMIELIREDRAKQELEAGAG